MTLIDEVKDQINQGTYLELCNELKKLYEKYGTDEDERKREREIERQEREQEREIERERFRQREREREIERQERARVLEIERQERARQEIERQNEELKREEAIRRRDHNNKLEFDRTLERKSKKNGDEFKIKIIGKNPENKNQYIFECGNDLYERYSATLPKLRKFTKFTNSRNNAVIFPYDDDEEGQEEVKRYYINRNFYATFTLESFKGNFYLSLSSLRYA